MPKAAAQYPQLSRQLSFGTAHIPKVAHCPCDKCDARVIQLVRERTGRTPTLRLAGDEFVVTLPRTVNEPG